jgi:hypothetical protein
MLTFIKVKKRRKMTQIMNDEMKKATNEQKATIIDLVQAEPCLWNMRLDVYHQMRNIAKNRIWDRISKAVGLDSEYFITFL